jgi:hypothetical protein
MRTYGNRLAPIALCAMLFMPCAEAQPPALKAKLDAKIPRLQALGTDPKVVEAVRAYNASMPPEAAAMTNEKWKAASQLDPAVRAYSKNPLAVYLKGRMDPAASEWFVSGAGGAKVAFMAKPTNWSHQGKEKHQLPMAGRIYYGPVEVDESSGQQQIQVGVPVLDGGRPIGSIVIGLPVSKL